jgi:hypothetical protein
MNNTNNPLQESQLDIDIKQNQLTKLKLEQQNIRLENKEKRIPYLVRPPFLAFIATIYVSLTTLIFFRANGVFDAKRTILTAGNASLELEKKGFNMRLILLKHIMIFFWK